MSAIKQNVINIYKLLFITVTKYNIMYFVTVPYQDK